MHDVKSPEEWHCDGNRSELSIKELHRMQFEISTKLSLSFLSNDESSSAHYTTLLTALLFVRNQHQEQSSLKESTSNRNVTLHGPLDRTSHNASTLYSPTPLKAVSTASTQFYSSKRILQVLERQQRYADHNRIFRSKMFIIFYFTNYVHNVARNLS